MTDIVLDDADGAWITIHAPVVKQVGSDLIIEAPERRRPDGPRFRRALVHDQNDGLTVNFNGDYPGGLTLNGVKRITPANHEGPPDPFLLLHIPQLEIAGGVTFAWQEDDGSVGSRSLQGEIAVLKAQVEMMQARLDALEAR